VAPCRSGDIHARRSRSARRGQDRNRINVNQNYEVRDWAQKSGVSPDELTKPVHAVGDRADKVEAHLKSKAGPRS